MTSEHHLNKNRRGWIVSAVVMTALLAPLGAQAQAQDAQAGAQAQKEESPSARRAREEAEAKKKAEGAKEGEEEAKGEGEQQAEGEGEVTEESPAARRAREEAEARKKKEEEEARKKAEAEKKKAEEEARLKAEAEAKAKAEAEEERKKKEAEDKKKSEMEQYEKLVEEHKAEVARLSTELFPGWAVGFGGGWVFSDLSDLNDPIFRANNIEPVDASGQLDLTLRGDAYLIRRVLISGSLNYSSTVGGNTNHSLTWLAVEPALVFREKNIQLLLGLKAGLGLYDFEGDRTDPLTLEVTKGAGYEGFGAVMEPGLTIRYTGSENFAVDARLGFRQFIPMTEDDIKGAARIDELPGEIAGNELLGYSGPVLSFSFVFGDFPSDYPAPPVKPEEPKEESADEGADKKEEAKKDEEKKDEPNIQAKAEEKSEAPEGESPSARRAREEREAKEKKAAEEAAEEKGEEPKDDSE